MEKRRAGRQGQPNRLLIAHGPHRRKDANRQDGDGAVDEWTGEELNGF